MTPFQPSDPAFLTDPYPTYAALRRDRPIFFYEAWQKWILTRYEDIQPLLKDKRLGRVMPGEAARGDYPNFEAIQTGSLLEIEPPDHTRIKRLVHDVFTPKHVRDLEADIEALCTSLAVDLLKRTPPKADLIRDFAEPIPVTVIADLLGVPPQDRHNLLPWSKAIIGMFEPERSLADADNANRAAKNFAAYIKRLMDNKRTLPQDDLISRMVHLHDADPEQLSEGEIIANCILFLNAGHEAVVNVIGNGMLALLKHPEQFARLKRDPSLIPTAVEEMMRFDTPLQFFERVTLEPVHYRGFHWPKGTWLCLYYASANRDPDVFENPETFDIGRDPNPHLAFGYGVHYCIGAPLARLELSVALKALLDRLPDLRLAENTPEYYPKNVFRYLKGLEVIY